MPTISATIFPAIDTEMNVIPYWKYPKNKQHALMIKENKNNLRST